jgi:hypothetical protein
LGGSVCDPTVGFVRQKHDCQIIRLKPEVSSSLFNSQGGYMLRRLQNYQVGILSAVAGLIWGGATQWLLTNWRNIPIISDNGIGTALLWLFGLLVLLILVAAHRAPAVLGGISATFWMSAVLGYYGSYIGLLVLSGSESLSWGEWSTYRALGQLFRTSVIVWLTLGLLGGFSIGWGWGQAQRRRQRV